MGANGTSPQEQFAVLAQRLRNGKTPDEVQQIVVETAVLLIDGCDRAAIGVLDGDRFRSGAHTDDVMRQIDDMQNELREGPCLEASADDVLHVDNDITKGSKWPRLAALVIARTSVRAMLAVPLVDEGKRSGALNVFSDRTDVFDEEAIEIAAILASFASVALAAARETQRADQLAQGMVTNREIGAAIGILMATHHIDQDEAFALLSKASQRLNRKLRDIASGIVRGAPTPDP
jgi:GAF domain-containing protein